jgi:hypothetical protein
MKRENREVRIVDRNNNVGYVCCRTGSAAKLQ